MPRSRFTPLAQDRTRKTVPLTAKVDAALVDLIEATARSLDVPRHRVLKAALSLGLPSAIAALTAQAQE